MSLTRNETKLMIQVVYCLTQDKDTSLDQWLYVHILYIHNNLLNEVGDLGINLIELTKETLYKTFSLNVEPAHDNNKWWY